MVVVAFEMVMDKEEMMVVALWMAVDLEVMMMEVVRIYLLTMVFEFICMPLVGVDPRHKTCYVVVILDQT